MEANNNLGRPSEAGALSNAEHQMLWRNRQKKRDRGASSNSFRRHGNQSINSELFVEKGYGAVIERA